MTSIQSKVSKISQALTSIEGLQVYHYWRTNVKAPYCIYYEMETVGQAMDGHTGEYGIAVYVDYFTQAEYDPKVDQIQEALNTVEGCAFHYEGAQFEEGTNLIHSSWECEVI